ncbi:MAG: DNA mismatch repair endonuclease MutL [Planctomycetia bacterium]
MPTIRPLPPDVVSKIAAGEVVERPASVVKELVENAIDAGASAVVVELVEGGRDLVRVVDDGVGIPAAELAAAVAPHATSKLRTADDLFAMRTFGFRGEALNSIAGVSEFTLQSKPFGQEAGARIDVDHGHIGEVRACGCPVGTVVEARHLFASVPARRKFLKNKQTEAGHVVEVMTRLALAYPAVGLKLIHNCRTVQERPPGLDRAETVRLFFGDAVADALIPIHEERDGYAVSGVVADPRVDRPTSRWQYLFCNTRYIRDRSLGHAVTEAYRGLILQGRYPVTFLFLDVPPDAVDVNAHPTKIEVRFAEPGRLYSLLLASLRGKFLKTDLVAKLQAKQAGQPPTTSAPADDLGFDADLPPWATAAAESTDTEPTPAAPTLAAPAPSFNDDHRRAAVDRDFALSRAPNSQRNRLWDEPIPAPSFTPVEVTVPAPTVTPTTPTPTAPTVTRSLQLHNSYLVVETPEGMLLVDQHALHERILYEQLRQRATAGRLEVQELLVPEPVELAPEEVGTMLEHRSLLEELGVRVDEFGSRCVLVHSYPALLRKLPTADLVRGLAAHLADHGRAPNRDAMLDEILSMMACKAAVKAGDHLTREEIDALVAQRHLVADSHHCPHGRPTILQFTLQDLERQFRRT